MSLLNPNLDNFRVEFSGNFYPDELTEPFDKFLKQFNGVIKTLPNLVHESIKGFTTPGLTLPEFTVPGMNNNASGNDQTSPNTISIDYISNVPFDEVIEGKLLTITMTNNLWNWVYANQMFRGMFNRNTSLKEFSVYATMYDAGQVPIFRFEFDNCIIKSLPPLTFDHASKITESLTFDLGIRFNNFGYRFMLPEFNQKITIL